MPIPKPTAIEKDSQIESKLKIMLIGKAIDVATLFTPFPNIGTAAVTPAIEAFDAGKNRPWRVREYAKKFLEILPKQFLILYYENLLNLGLENTIRRTELRKGEADQKDFFGEPSGFDQSFFIAEKI